MKNYTEIIGSYRRKITEKELNNNSGSYVWLFLGEKRHRIEAYWKLIDFYLDYRYVFDDNHHSRSYQIKAGYKLTRDPAKEVQFATLRNRVFPFVEKNEKEVLEIMMNDAVKHARGLAWSYRAHLLILEDNLKNENMLHGYLRPDLDEGDEIRKEGTDYKSSIMREGRRSKNSLNIGRRRVLL